MNRAKLKKIVKKIAELKGEVDEVFCDEQNRYDALSERRQEGEIGQTMSDAINNLEIALDSLDDAEDHINTVLGS